MIVSLDIDLRLSPISLDEIKELLKPIKCYVHPEPLQIEDCNIMEGWLKLGDLTATRGGYDSSHKASKPGLYVIKIADGINHILSPCIYIGQSTDAVFTRLKQWDCSWRGKKTARGSSYLVFKAELEKKLNRTIRDMDLEIWYRPHETDKSEDPSIKADSLLREKIAICAHFIMNEYHPDMNKRDTPNQDEMDRVVATLQSWTAVPVKKAA